MDGEHCYTCGGVIPDWRGLRAGGPGRCEWCEGLGDRPPAPATAAATGAVGGAGPMAGRVPPPPPAVFGRAPVASAIGGSMLLACAFGFAAALGGAMVWYVVVVTLKLQSAWLSVGLGALIGRAVLIGAGRRPAIELQVLAMTFALVALVGSEYFIGRYFLIDALRELGDGVTDVPLFMPFDQAKLVVTESLKAEPITYVFWLLALGAAFYNAGDGRLAPRPVTHR